jgi:hypothetical protein
MSAGEDAVRKIHDPIQHDGQRGSALRFGDRRVLALLATPASCAMVSPPSGHVIHLAPPPCATPSAASRTPRTSC